MPHLSLVAMSGFRVREMEMLTLGMTLPGLHDRAAAIAALPSLGLLTLAALTPDNWTITYHEARDVDSAFVERLLREHPSLVAVSALTASVLDAYRLADLLKSCGVHTVLGGLHATVRPQEAAAHFDAVVIGDGEPVWQQLLSDAAAGRLQQFYRNTRPFNLGEAPTPRFDLLGTKERPRFTLQTSRGCPFACDFCGASRLLGPFREKPAPLIERELDAIRGASPSRRPTIELADDNTFAGRRSAPELLGTLERADIRYFTESDWRIGERPEVLDCLAASGCVQVLIGVESLTPRHAGMGTKRAPLPRVMDAVARIQESGVAVIACFVLGADGETHESIQELADFLTEAPFADIQLTIQTPFPGTALHDRLAKAGRLLSDRSWESYTLFDVTYQPDVLSAEALQRAFHNLVRHVFAEGPTRRRAEIRKSIWAKRGGAA